MLRVAVLLLVLVTVPLRANLGESIAQCVARYGKPDHFTEATDKTPFGTMTFTAGPYGLIVFVLNGKEVGARVSKKDGTSFSAAEMKNIMDADSNSTMWEPVTSDDPTCLQWSRTDKATVLYDKEKNMLIFTADEMAKALYPEPEKSAPAPSKSAQPAKRADDLP